MRCLVACCGSEVELKDVTDNHEEENAEEDDPQSDEPTIRENCIMKWTVLLI